MSTKTDASQEYVSSLKRIKQAEDLAQAEIEERQKLVEEEIKKLQAASESAIESAKAQGEKLVETSLEEARKRAAVEANKILEDAKAKSKTISIKVDTKTMKKIIDILQKVED